MPIVMCIICNGTGYTREPKAEDIGEQCFYCNGEGQLLQDSGSSPCGGVATKSEYDEAMRRGLRRA